MTPKKDDRSRQLADSRGPWQMPDGGWVSILEFAKVEWDYWIAVVQLVESEKLKVAGAKVRNNG